MMRRSHRRSGRLDLAHFSFYLLHRTPGHNNPLVLVDVPEQYRDLVIALLHQHLHTSNLLRVIDWRAVNGQRTSTAASLVVQLSHLEEAFMDFKHVSD
jgi:hypothetical protein